ncbi:DENN domain-containing protein 2D-like [Carlito syrichta]|uniref:C-X-C motif chemokine n=1 Tax=Carlito syrichta TaxID=1868482 RepID=A0A1U7U1N3_CARSF|nr:DENN domain-containing protein 2D-like [Carlito syrichta]
MARAATLAVFRVPRLPQAALLLLLLVVAGRHVTGAPVVSELRCQCLQSAHGIHPKNIRSVKVTSPGPHCAQTEVIATLKNGQDACLNPTAPMVKKIIQRMLNTAHLPVVSLKKKHLGDDYEPTITYQFPKWENLLWGQQEEEERLLKAILLFCFPDGNAWAPLTEYPRETFSFILTNVNGSRKIGYCRRLLPAGPGPRLPKVYCIISCIGCFGLFSKILDEVEKRHQISMTVIYPFMQGLREAAFPAPGKTVTLKSFIPDSGTEFISLTRPLDSHLEHMDFSSLLQCLGFEQILQIFASAVLERKIIFLAEGLSTLSQCIHAAAALLYPFSWAHIPVVPESLLATVYCPTHFMVGVQMRFRQAVLDSPMEEVLLVNLCEGTFLMSVGDEKDILPPKLQDDILDSLDQGINELTTAEQINEHVSGPFVQFFVKTVGHYASFIKREANGQGHFQERPFCKALTSKTNRQFVKKFVKTRLFSLFIQEAEKSKNPPAGYFQQKILEC